VHRQLSQSRFTSFSVPLKMTKELAALRLLTPVIFA
jgi:hypothetical protein